MVTEAMSVYYQLIAADGTRKMRANLGDDEPVGVMKPLLSLASLPLFLQKIVAARIKSTRSVRFGSIIECATEKRVDQFWDLLVRRNEIRNAFADQVLSKYDGVISCGFYIPAPPCGSTTQLSFGCACTAYYNVLDLPVVSMPVSLCTPADNWPNRPTRGMSREVSALYDEDRMSGLPVGIQVATAKCTEEKALAIACRIEGLLKRQ